MIPALLSKKYIFLSLFILFICITTITNAQTTLQKPEVKSRIAVSITDGKTSVWISDFPKNTSIVLFDEEYQMLSILSTNDFGAGFTRLPSAYNSRIYAKTLHGEIVAAAIMPDKADAKVARIDPNNSSKS